MTTKDFAIYILFPIITAIIAGIVVEAIKRNPLIVKFKPWNIKKIKSKQEDSPKFIEYTKDVIDGFVFKWNWVSTPNGWQIINFRICCPIDETPLVVEEMFYIRCPRCKKEYFNTPDINSARIIVQDNIVKRYEAIFV
jgi:hypothetical protein